MQQSLDCLRYTPGKSLHHENEGFNAIYFKVKYSVEIGVRIGKYLSELVSIQYSPNNFYTIYIHPDRTAIEYHIGANPHNPIRVIRYSTYHFKDGEYRKFVNLLLPTTTKSARKV